MNTKTLDEKLRERAQVRLRRDVDKLFEPLWQALAKYSPPMIYGKTELHEPLGNKFVAANNGEALKMIETSVLEGWKPHYEQEEIDAFMSRLDQLGTEVQELRDSIEA